MPPFTVRGPSRPANPGTGGHYVPLGNNQWQLIHAVGPGRWAPGPPQGRAGRGAGRAQPLGGGSGVPANSPLLNPNATLSGNALLQAAQALANAQTQGPTSEIQSQIAQNNRQTTGALNLTGGYFNQLGRQAQSGVNQEGQIANDLNQRLSGINTDEQGQLRGIGQNAQSSLLKYAPQSDSQNSLANPVLQSLAQEMARQQGLAAQDQGANRSFGATQGANYKGLAASNLGTFGLRGQEALKGIAQAGQVKNEPLEAKLAGLIAAKGADFTTALGKLRQQEITNDISRTGLGIREQANLINQANNVRNNATSNLNNVRTTGTSAANNQRNNATSRANNAANNNPNAIGSPAWARVQNATGRQWSNNPNAVGSPAWARVRHAGGGGGGGGARPLTTQENNHWFSTLGQLEQLIRDGQHHGQAEANIRGFLASGQNPSRRSFDPFMIQVAYELLGYGSVNASTAAIMHNQYGLRGGTYNGRPIRVTANYVNPATTTGNAAGNAIAGVGGRA